MYQKNKEIGSNYNCFKHKPLVCDEVYSAPEIRTYVSVVLISVFFYRKRIFFLFISYVCIKITVLVK